MISITARRNVKSHVFIFLVTMAKGIGNGFPMAAVVTTPKIAQCLTQAIHFNTFGGNPMATTVGSAVLDVSTFSCIFLCLAANPLIQLWFT